MKNFSGKTVYITGGASGIGLGTGRRLAAMGAHIVVLDFNPTDAAHAALEHARCSPAQHIARYQVDMADRAAVLAAVARAANEAGAPDIVINCAGIGVTGEFASMRFEDFDRVIQVNLYGSRHLCEAVLPLMRARGHGNIVLVASMAGITPVYGYTDYGTSKYAVLGFAECLRYELKPLGIEVQICCPGEVETPMVAAERLIIHPATRALKDAGGSIGIDQAVRELIDGMARGKAIFVLGGKARLTFWLRRLVPPSLWYWITDQIVRKAMKTKKAI
ncbi:MAG: SDR family NAD(P)-dependent oxidoreductase [Pseudomonadota bacterium]